MKLKIDTTKGLGASIPGKKSFNVTKRFREIVEHEISFQDYEFLIFRYFIVDEQDCTKIARKHFKDTFIVESWYPISKVQDMLIDERIVVQAEIYMRSLYKLYEHFKLDHKELDDIKDTLISEGILKA